MTPAFDFQIRHPEFISGSISPLDAAAWMARWMLKQVQHDDVCAVVA